MGANLILQRCSLTVSRDGGSLITAAHLDLLNNDPMHRNGSSRVCGRARLSVCLYIHTQKPKSHFSTSEKTKKKALKVHSACHFLQTRHGFFICFDLF